MNTGFQVCHILGMHPAGSLFLLYLVSCRQICLFFRSDSLVKLGVI